MNTRVTIKHTLGRGVEGTVTDTVRNGAVSFVEWDNGSSNWYDTATLTVIA